MSGYTDKQVGNVMVVGEMENSVAKNWKMVLLQGPRRLYRSDKILCPTCSNNVEL